MQLLTTRSRLSTIEARRAEGVIRRSAGSDRRITPTGPRLGADPLCSNPSYVLLYLAGEREQ
ncbi:hypothetical protein [Bradyrhizobium sp. Ash2021]|jgi:hypothetical protein|uniref:hypothetical protein n=1 Tax=Bradyrhizobium sp. Ash2021 TaxID=2954771 RepID=UPI0028169432|nr:hypothetical protein [Bradyrhizobium sp. Ash2021]WMT75485.1 hypothetical protein NL528_03425 [Bradyrhizobium sp. Ash2021]